MGEFMPYTLDGNWLTKASATPTIFEQVRLCRPVIRNGGGTHSRQVVYKSRNQEY